MRATTFCSGTHGFEQRQPKLQYSSMMLGSRTYTDFLDQVQKWEEVQRVQGWVGGICVRDAAASAERWRGACLWSGLDELVATVLACITQNLRLSK